MQQSSCVPVEFSAFTGLHAYLNGSHDLAVTPEVMMWGAITVGAPSFAAVVASLADSVAFALHKALAIITVTDWSEQYLRIPDYYDRLEQSEKTALAFWTGMALSKVVAGIYLDVPCPQHLRPLQQRGRLTVSPPSTKSLPDLAGQDRNGGWHVIEAKARRRAPSQKEAEAWKQQARVVTTINGQSPVTSSYCAARWGKPYSVRVVDPVPDNNDAERLHLRFERTGFIGAYYAPIIAFVGEDELAMADSNDPVYRTVGYDPVSARYYELGLLPRIYDAIREGTRVRAADAFHSQDTFMGSDGIAVRSRRRPF